MVVIFEKGTARLCLVWALEQVCKEIKTLIKHAMLYYFHKTDFIKV